MQGKILTIIGIVLIFGYFIKESFQSPSMSNPGQIIMVGNDTLGRDWGALAEQKAREKTQISEENDAPKTQSANSATEVKSISSEDTDPFKKEKLDQNNYSSIQSAGGREIITGYNRPEEQNNLDINTQSDNYQTRHQREKGQQQVVTEEPTIIYKE